MTLVILLLIAALVALVAWAWWDEGRRHRDLARKLMEDDR